MSNDGPDLSERLGFGREDRLLIINCDDVGSSHSAKVAAFRASRLPSRREGRREVPGFRISAGDIDIGAAWKKASREGRDYISVKLDDPSFPPPVYATLSETAGEYALIWSR